MSSPPAESRRRQHQSSRKLGFVVLRGGESRRIFHALALVPCDAEMCQRKERDVFSPRFLRADHDLPQRSSRSSSFALYFHAFGLESGAATHISGAQVDSRRGISVDTYSAFHYFAAGRLSDDPCQAFLKDLLEQIYRKWKRFPLPVSEQRKTQKQTASPSPPARDSRETLAVFLCFSTSSHASFVKSPSPLNTPKPLTRRSAEQSPPKFRRSVETCRFPWAASG